VWNLASHTEGRTEAASDVEKGAVEDIRDEVAREWKEYTMRSFRIS